MLGRTSTLTVEQARDKAREIRRKLAAGLDPRHADPTRALTFRELVDRWHKEAQRGKVSGDSTRTFVLFHTSRWSNRPAATIQRHEVGSLLQGVRFGSSKRKGAPQSANRLHSHLRTIFAWAVEQGLPGFTSSPVMSKPPAPDVQKPREREWFRGDRADAVIKALWQCPGRWSRTKRSSSSC